MREVMQNADKLRAPGESSCGLPAIEVRRLTVIRAGQTVLDAVDLRVESGQFVAVLGANGAGKTTLLRCCAALLRPMSGEVRLCGKSPWQDYDARRVVGLVAHESHLYASLTPTENLKFAARMYGVPDSDQRIAELLAATGLEHCSVAPTSRLSRGMKQRLSIARALVHQPAVLLFDEPFAGLDDDGRRWLCKTLDRLRDGGTAICCTTHEPALAVQLADRILQLEDCRLTACNRDADVIGEERAWANAA